MFPPETMQTTFPPPALPATAAATAERAGALGDHPHALGDQAHRRGGVVERDDERAVDQLRTTCSQTAGISERLPAPSTHERA